MLRPWWLLLLLLWSLRLCLLAALTIALALAFAASGTLLPRAALFFASLSRPLLEVADLPLHEPAGLLFLLGARDVVAAVGATFPSLGI